MFNTLALCILNDNCNDIIEKRNIQRPKTYEELLFQIKYNLKNLPNSYQLFFKINDNSEKIISNNNDYKKVKDIIYIKKSSINKINDYKRNKSLNNKLNLKNNYEEEKNQMILNDFKYYNNQNFNILLKNILNKINEIHSVIKSRFNNKISLDIDNIPIKEIPTIIFEELEKILKFINANFKEIYNNKPINKNKNKDNINLIYYTSYPSVQNIFGEKFVENNYDNIELIINGTKTNLVKEYKLEKGENIIELLIKSKLTNIDYMFYECNSLKSIHNLKYLDTKDIKSFSYIFYKCSSLTDIKSLESLSVDKINNFQGMFWGCSSLSDISSIQNWIVSNADNFSYMFCECISLSDLKPIRNWTFKNGNNFKGMFFGCTSLSYLKPLENWNVSNINDFSIMFCGCSSLMDLRPIENWNVSNGNNFKYMFAECDSLSDLTPLKNWNVSHGINFQGMFYKCQLILNKKVLQNWNISNNNFKSLYKK